MSTFDTAARSATLQQAALEASTVPKRKHPVFNRRELRLLGIAHLFGRTILLSRDVDCHRMIKRLLAEWQRQANLLSPPRGREHKAETLWRGGLAHMLECTALTAGKT